MAEPAVPRYGDSVPLYARSEFWGGFLICSFKDYRDSVASKKVIRLSPWTGNKMIKGRK